MLETLGLVVHAIPRIAERFREIRFDDAMATNGAKRGTASSLRQPHAAVALVRDQALLREATDHSTHRSRRKAELRGDLVRSGNAGGRFQREDDLEIILDRRGDGRIDFHRGHVGAGRDGVDVRWPRTSNTGIRDECRTSFATLPYNRSLMKRCPCVDIAIK